MKHKPLELAWGYGGHTEWRHRPFVGTSVRALRFTDGRFAQTDRDLVVPQCAVFGGQFHVLLR
jgi:hypothetical protein